MIKSPQVPLLKTRMLTTNTRRRLEHNHTEICDKVQSHISFDAESSIHDLCDILLEPQSETIIHLANTFHVHHLLLDFFEAGLESWEIFEQLLESIHQVNANHRKVKHIIKLAQRVPQGKQCPKIYEELASYSTSRNPLSDFCPEKFPEVHTTHKLLLKRLTTKHMRIKRERKSAGLTACSFGLIKKRNLANKGVKTSELERVGAQLDVAAKGVYTMNKDLDTMGSLVVRLHNEVEFGRAMARKCVRNWKSDVLEEVTREFKVHESCFLELFTCVCLM